MMMVSVIGRGHGGAEAMNEHGYVKG